MSRTSCLLCSQNGSATHWWCRPYGGGKALQLGRTPSHGLYPVMEQLDRHNDGGLNVPCRFKARRAVYRMVQESYEKIWDPRQHRFYYYNKARGSHHRQKDGWSRSSRHTPPNEAAAPPPPPRLPPDHGHFLVAQAVPAVRGAGPGVDRFHLHQGAAASLPLLEPSMSPHPPTHPPTLTTADPLIAALPLASPRRRPLIRPRPRSCCSVSGVRSRPGSAWPSSPTTSS